MILEFAFAPHLNHTALHPPRLAHPQDLPKAIAAGAEKRGVKRASLVAKMVPSGLTEWTVEVDVFGVLVDFSREFLRVF